MEKRKFNSNYEVGRIMITNIENGTLADWKNVLNDTDEKLINESNVQIYNFSDVVNPSSLSLGGTDQSSYANINALKKAPTTINRDKKIATFEWNFWLLDGTFDVLDDTQDEKIQGWLTNTLSDNNCYLQQYIYFSGISNNQKKQINTVKFNPAYGYVPKMVYLYSNGINVAYDLEAMADNDFIEDAQYVYLNYPQFANMDDTMFFTIRDTNMPYRRGRITEWNLGFEFFVDKNDLQDYEHSRTCKLNMTELPQNDIVFSFADKLGYFDPLKVNQAYKHTFSKNDDFYVYYGYNLDIGWSWALVEMLKFNELEVDRDSIKTTIKLESPMNRWDNKYKSTELKTDTWSNLSGLITKLYSLATGSSSGIQGQANLNLANVNKTHWRDLLVSICRHNNEFNFVNSPVNELLQQAIAFGNGFLLRTPTGWEIKKFVDSNGQITSGQTPLPSDDTIKQELCFSFPLVEEQEKYTSGTFESASYEGQDADEEVTPTGQVYTLLPYRKTISLLSGNIKKEFTGHSDILVIGYKNNTTEWLWTDNAHSKFLWYITTFDCGTKITINDCIMNPLIQLGDIIKVFTDSAYANYQGIVEEITINYDGSFRGKIVINQPYAVVS